MKKFAKFVRRINWPFIGRLAAILTILGAPATLFWCRNPTTSQNSPSVEIQDSNLDQSPIFQNSPGAKVDYSVTVNKILPEIEFGTLTDMSVTEGPPYTYSFTLRYSTTMDTPASYEIDFINIEWYESIEDEDGNEQDILLGSTRIKDSFESWGMRRKEPVSTFKFTTENKFERIKVRLVMGIEGGQTREDSRSLSFNN